MIIPSPSSAPECPLFLLAPTTALREWAGLLWPGVEKLLLLRGPFGLPGEGRERRRWEDGDVPQTDAL